ncbi:N-acetyltransferase [Enterococcus asini]|uniref:GNAT family N-acetyltransferase n=1 Tax=Enterococcus asini TaxID=57732 RepID=UPI0028901A17|nr:N-acetyltransferase [Enterococcus asini]MDT2757458.1 N-acetyltransferase [Enterococcus asini]
MKIRQATTQDYPAIRDLITQAFKTACISHGEEADFVEKLRSGATFQPELELVAESDGQIVGHVLLAKLPFATSASAANRLLAPLSVAFHYRNQGIGTELFAQVFEKARKFSTQTFVIGLEQSDNRGLIVPDLRVYQQGKNLLEACQIGVELLPNPHSPV